MKPADKARGEMNKRPVREEFTVKDIADAIDEDPSCVSWMMAGLVKAGYLGKRTEPLSLCGGIKAFFWRIRVIDIKKIKAKSKVDKKQVKLYDGTDDPWYQFVCGGRL